MVVVRDQRAEGRGRSPFPTLDHHRDGTFDDADEHRPLP